MGLMWMLSWERLWLICSQSALSVFESIKERAVGSWNSIIHNPGVLGYGKEALDMFSDMLRSNIQPDEITLLGILGPCSHSGLPEDGKKYFQLMSEEYGLARKTVHYGIGCMEDLCRTDLSEKARDLIEISQMISSVPIWGALLGASCRLGNLVMGEYAAKNLMELDPFDGSCHIVLSMYKSAGLYEKSIGVRKMTTDRGPEKEQQLMNSE